MKLSKIDNNGITLYLTIKNGINMLTGNPAKALKMNLEIEFIEYVL